MRSISNAAGAELCFASIGSGEPVLLVLHGAYSTHDEVQAVFEPLLGGRGVLRIYPDLPGMGASPTHGSLSTSNDVVDLLETLLDREVGDGAILIAGHSYGGHLARGLAARRPHQVAGLALLCPLMPATMNAEPYHLVRSEGRPRDLVDQALWGDYAGYFVIHTAATARRFNEVLAPLIGRWDGAAVERIMTSWALEPDPATCPLDVPALVLTGRHDAFVGYRDQWSLLDLHPSASYVAIADAGHALLHEQPELVAVLLDRWLDRCLDAGARINGDRSAVTPEGGASRTARRTLGA